MTDTGSWGADVPQGPDWYQAADGKWYPPTTSSPEVYASGVGGGIDVGFDGPLEVNRWKPLYNWIIAIPHLILVYIFEIGAAVMSIVAFFQLLFTGRIPEGTQNFIVKVMRYQWRVVSFAGFMREDSPKPYGLVGTDIDPRDDPAWLSVPYDGNLNRWAVLYKWILAIPATIVVFFYGIGAAVFWIIAFFQVLFTGTWSQSQRDFIVRVMRQSTRINAYILLSDEKPPITPE